MRKTPSAIAGQPVQRAAFGDHPYGSAATARVDSVTALTRDDVVAAHRAALARDRMFVAAAGDITAAELGPLLDTLLGDLPDIGRQLPGRARLAADGRGRRWSTFPGPQSVVLFGQRGIARDDPDFFAAFVLNEILGGGGFSARLMNEVREKRGLTYGIGTYLAPMDLRRADAGAAVHGATRRSAEGDRS